ncbi:hypothetical protein CENSYa_0427 [Cenarchaeum symbiosum A]|uniref:Uncharacterized protein n=1 Tax=Cenarchaeum symbiosum (strain A) TaxID=414004 RepID=A0RUP5_CENSY|nr:hypothetical protein CENSYa_0427 [Cenarchaeum symbiosum A]
MAPFMRSAKPRTGLPCHLFFGTAKACKQPHGAPRLCGGISPDRREPAASDSIVAGVQKMHALQRRPVLYSMKRVIICLCPRDNGRS